MNPDPTDPNLARQARDFALRAHGNQKYGDHPYAYHLDAVAEILEPFGSMAQAVGYLHDVAEDTAIGIDEIRNVFGDQVARCVALVTDCPGANRAERKVATNAKLAKVDGDERLALIVKAADRLANLRMSALSGNDTMLNKYRGEHPAFRDAAFRPGLCDDLWNAMGMIFAAPA